MTLVVPFDGSALSEAALVRATEFGEAFDDPVLVVSVVPANNAAYARKRGWLASDESFDLDAVVSTLHEWAVSLCPSADFSHEVVGRYANPGTIANRVRRMARGADASMVVVGSENAGHVVTSLSSVGSGIAADDSYDVVVVRHRRPEAVAARRDADDDQPPKSDFYLPE